MPINKNKINNYSWILHTKNHERQYNILLFNLFSANLTFLPAYILLVHRGGNKATIYKRSKPEKTTLLTFDERAAVLVI